VKTYKNMTDASGITNRIEICYTVQIQWYSLCEGAHRFGLNENPLQQATRQVSCKLSSPKGAVDGCANSHYDLGTGCVYTEPETSLSLSLSRYPLQLGSLGL